MLRDCLQSLQEEFQSIQMEIIVVDNASTDGAADMVAEEFPHVMLVRNHHNRGFSAANNQAAKAAQGRYLFFLNNDTIVPPGFLHEMLMFAEDHPEAGMIGPRLRDPQGNVQVSYRPRPTVLTLLHRTMFLRWTGLLRGAYRQYRRAKFDSETAREVDILMGAAIFTPREKFLSWGGWDEDFQFGGEDMELSIRAARFTKLVYWPEVEIIHHGRSSTRQSPVASTQIAIGLVRYLRKTGTCWPVLLMYKAALTLDTPITLLCKLAETLYRRLQGRKAKAAKSWVAARVCWHFLTRGLLDFWKA